MTAPLMVILGVVSIGLIFVIGPIVIDTYRRYRLARVVDCPEARTSAEVRLNTRKAMLAAAFGRSLLRVKSCSLWPARKGCAEACVGENWPETRERRP
ncbi:MAG TPA: hypothetical protein VNN77_15340 [candidate division Zixibacteria bacterium]|nr:hypothetical protein [candidate division Zixibacteria bacterium]